MKHGRQQSSFPTLHFTAQRLILAFPLRRVHFVRVSEVFDGCFLLFSEKLHLGIELVDRQRDSKDVGSIVKIDVRP